MADYSAIVQKLIQMDKQFVEIFDNREKLINSTAELLKVNTDFIYVLLSNKFDDINMKIKYVEDEIYNEEIIKNLE